MPGSVPSSVYCHSSTPRSSVGGWPYPAYQMGQSASASKSYMAPDQWPFMYTTLRSPAVSVLGRTPRVQCGLLAGEGVCPGLVCCVELQIVGDRSCQSQRLYPLQRKQSLLLGLGFC